MGKTSRREFAVQCGGVAAAVSMGQSLGARDARAETRAFEVSIDIVGLNAIVVDRPGRRAEVLFVDPSALGLRMPSHTPFLTASISDVTNAEDSDPTTVVGIPGAGGLQQVGLWDLTDTQVLVRRPGGGELGGGVTFHEGTGAVPTSPPERMDDPEAWRDLRYVADLQRICGQSTIAPGLSSLGSASTGAQPPRQIRGRVRFGGGLLEGAIPSAQIHRDKIFQFSTGEGSEVHRQPLTDTLRWSLSNQDRSDGSNYVVVDLVSLREGRQATRTLMLSDRGRACRLSISNMPVHDDGAASQHGTEEEMAALHFGAYYKLLRKQPADQPLPRLWVPPADRRLGLGGPVMCPPARFTRN